MTSPSICIPFVYSNIDDQTVIKTITELGLGNNITIESKNIMNKRGESGRTIRININWFKNVNATKVRRQLAEGKSINVNYSPKAFWKLFAYKTAVLSASKLEELYGPKVGPNCREKQHEAQIRIDPNFVPKQQLFRPKSPDMPPPSKQLFRPKSPDMPPPVKDEENEDVIICIDDDDVDNFVDFPDEFENSKIFIEYGTVVPPMHKKIVPTYKPQPTTSQLLYGDL
jgi:hypothetical protein